LARRLVISIVVYCRENDCSDRREIRYLSSKRIGNESLGETLHRLLNIWIDLEELIDKVPEVRRKIRYNFNKTVSRNKYLRSHRN